MYRKTKRHVLEKRREIKTERNKRNSSRRGKRKAECVFAIERERERRRRKREERGSRQREEGVNRTLTF